jgi:L-fuconolactonase
VLRRDFLPGDLKTAREQTGVDQSIAVQARSTIEETAWLLQLTEIDDSIAGVVGWVPLSAPGVEADIERFAGHPKLVAFRHVVQDEPDDRYLLRPDFNAGVARLRRFGLAYDILVFEKHLAAAIEFVDRHPSQVFVLDHMAKPRIRDGALSPWRENIQKLARRSNVYCKLSGIVTEANWEAWKPADLAPYFDVVLNAFTPKRLMFGSDWPVLLLAGTYQGWFSHVKNAIAELTEAEQNRVWGGTAAEAYKLLPYDRSATSAA